MCINSGWISKLIVHAAYERALCEWKEKARGNQPWLGLTVGKVVMRMYDELADTLDVPSKTACRED